MRALRFSLFSGAFLAGGVILFGLSGCGGDATTVAPGFTLTAAALSPTSVKSGDMANATITVAPTNGFTGSVSLACSIGTTATPAPGCSFSNSALTISGGNSVTSMLTVSTATETPGGSYKISVIGRDANNLAPSNGAQTLTLTAAAVIQHIVIIFQENRTPDNLFHDPVLMSRGADIARSGTNSLGQSIALTPIDLGTVGSNPQNYDLDHSHKAFVSMYAGGKMNGANLVLCSPPDACPPKAHPNAQFMYVNPTDVLPYFAMAETYTFGDRMFQTNEGPSFPAHQFIFSGTSAPTTFSTLFAAENPNQPSGCLGPPTDTVVMINAAGSETAQPPEHPCFEHPTMSDHLETNGITWRYYTPTSGSIWTAPDAIEHICQQRKTVSGELICDGPDWHANVIVPQTRVLTDIANGELPQVSWIIPNGAESDHAGVNDGSGPSWVTSIVNAIGQSKYWANTAIIITWDDWGGWFDHVTPKVINDGFSWGSGYVYGFRVPLIVVSPYAKAAYISHVTHDFGSILKLIETTFNVPALGYADDPADDMSDCFNLTQTPIPFKIIPAPLDATFFLNDKREPTDPDDD